MARKGKGKKRKPKFVDKDMGYKAIKRFFKTAHSRKVDVGIFGDSKDFDSPSYAALGSIHEYGSKDGTIPSRSFIRSTFDENRKKYKKNLTKLIDRALATRGKIKVEDAYNQFGEQVIADITRRIVQRKIKQDLKYRKGTALYDTGGLVGSIDKKVTRK